MSDIEPMPDWAYDDIDDEAEDDDFDFDCHMHRSGFCGAAGSEFCEFECPYRADQRNAEKAGRRYLP